VNPILPGFHPDPSIVRVGADYYLANSTFEWFPGVRLHHSRDLVNWTSAGYAVTRGLQLRGVPDSGGVWAPSLSHHDGLFWLVYAVVYTKDGPFKDIEVFLTTAPSIAGPWSEPRYLGADGFDPSIFHDTDGRHWLLNMAWDHRPDMPSFAGITLRELDPEHGLVGPRRLIHSQEELVEGPNLYKRDGWYHLMLAEGGTGWNHGITTLRSRRIEGPYEPDPGGPMLTTRDNEDIRLQKAGHGELVETEGGDWYLVHLASRPLRTPSGRRCMLGRETCLQRVDWPAGGRPRLASGGHWPSDTIALDVPRDRPSQGERDEFDSARLSEEWMSLRRPVDESWLSLTERPGRLRLKGRHSLHSRFEQSLIARRLTSHRATASTSVEFRPEFPGQHAGLVCWYDTTTYFFLCVAPGRRLLVAGADDGAYFEHETGMSIMDGSPVHLRATFDDGELRFAASVDGGEWTDVGPVMDATVLSDDYGSSLRFTGAFVGLAVQDPVSGTLAADFGYFDYFGDQG
jgi:xylan 1,4-beta-xylosidase